MDAVDATRGKEGFCDNATSMGALDAESTVSSLKSDDASLRRLRSTGSSLVDSTWSWRALRIESTARYMASSSLSYHELPWIGEQPSKQTRRCAHDGTPCARLHCAATLSQLYSVKIESSMSSSSMPVVHWRAWRSNSNPHAIRCTVLPMARRGTCV